MSIFARVNGFVEEGQFFGREILSVTVNGLTAAPAVDAEGNPVIWPDLDAVIQAIETTNTVSLVGVRGPGAVVVNLLLEGGTGDDAADLVALTALVDAAVTGSTVTANAL